MVPGVPGVPKGPLVLFAFLIASCAAPDRDIRFFRSEAYTFSRAERRLIEDVTHATVREVRSLLPGIPERIYLTVRPGKDVIEETGEIGTAMPPDGIMWTVDPGRAGGVEAVVKEWLRACLFHELHHLARLATQPAEGLVDRAILEGMATVFERDFAHTNPPWRSYPDNVGLWADELLKLPRDASDREWMSRHPDGRRRIGYKVGTYWVDQAMAKSARSIADLTNMSTADVLALAR